MAVLAVVVVVVVGLPIKLVGPNTAVFGIMNFYSPVSNTRCHSIGHKMRIARIKIRVDSPGRWEGAILKRCVLSLERNIGREDEFLI